jgi:hypothetical protein
MDSTSQAHYGVGVHLHYVVCVVFSDEDGSDGQGLQYYF